MIYKIKRKILKFKLNLKKNEIRNNINSLKVSRSEKEHELNLVLRDINKLKSLDNIRIRIEAELFGLKNELSNEERRLNRLLMEIRNNNFITEKK